MREVGVHLDHELGAAGQRTIETGEIRVAEPGLRLTVEHLDVVELDRQRVSDRTGAVGRAVIDDQDAVLRRRDCAQLHGGRPDDPLDVGCLVVGGNHNPDRRLHRCSSVVGGAGERRRGW